MRAKGLIILVTLIFLCNCQNAFGFIYFSECYVEDIAIQYSKTNTELTSPDTLNQGYDYFKYWWSIHRGKFPYSKEDFESISIDDVKARGIIDAFVWSEFLTHPAYNINYDSVINYPRYQAFIHYGEKEQLYKPKEIYFLNISQEKTVLPSNFGQAEMNQIKAIVLFFNGEKTADSFIGSMIPLIEKFNNLEYLEVVGVGNLSESGSLSFREMSHQVLQLPNIQRIKFLAAKSLSLKSVVSINDSFSNLQRLWINQIVTSTNEDVFPKAFLKNRPINFVRILSNPCKLTGEEFSELSNLEVFMMSNHALYSNSHETDWINDFQIHSPKLKVLQISTSEPSIVNIHDLNELEYLDLNLRPLKGYTVRDGFNLKFSKLPHLKQLNLNVRGKIQIENLKQLESMHCTESLSSSSVYFKGSVQNLRSLIITSDTIFLRSQQSFSASLKYYFTYSDKIDLPEKKLTKTNQSIFERDEEYNLNILRN